MSKRILLTKGKSTIVDSADYDWLMNSGYRWYAHKWSSGKYYVVGANKKRDYVYMHRLILDAPDGITVDHVDGDGLNNQRVNLRLATQTQQNCNRSKTRRNKTGYKGVRYIKKKDKYRAEIRYQKKAIHLGYFDDPEEAASAYNNAAKRYFGEFAKLNEL